MNFHLRGIQLPDGIVNLAGYDTTRVLECLAGLRPLQNGICRWDGIDIYEETPVSLKMRREISCAFDHRGLLFGISLLENLTLPLLYHRRAADEEAEKRALTYLEAIGMLAEKDLRPAQVTAAQRKLCVLARSLIVHPACLVWEEPTQGLTRNFAKHLSGWISRHQQDHGLRQVFLSSQDDDFLKFCGAKNLTLAQEVLSGVAA